MLKLLSLHDDKSVLNSLSEFKVIEGVLHEDNVDELHEDLELLEDLELHVGLELLEDLELHVGLELLEELELQLEREQLPN